MVLIVDRMEVNYGQESPYSWDGIQVRVARTPEYARVDVTFIADLEGMQVLERVRNLATLFEGKKTEELKQEPSRLEPKQEPSRFGVLEVDELDSEEK